MADTGYVLGGVIFIVFLVSVLTGFALHNAQTQQSIDCPWSPEEISEGLSGNSTNIFIQFSTTVGVMLTPCSGIPWWIYLLFAIIVIGVVVWIIPFVG